MELGNKDVLETIEKSLFFFFLDDEVPTDDSECCWKTRGMIPLVSQKISNRNR